VSNLFLLVASGGHNTEEHYTETIQKGVQLKDLSDFVSENKKKEIADVYGERTVRLWGAKPGERNIRNWKEMKRGDSILIYRNKKIEYVAKITIKLHNKPLAKELWGQEDGVTWEYIYLLDDLRKVDMALEDFNELLGYSKENFFSGLTPIAQEIIDSFGSVGGLVSNLIEKSEEVRSIEDLEKTKKEEAEKAVSKKTQSDSENLEEFIKERSKKSVQGERIVQAKTYKRDRELIAALKSKYDGVCQSCGKTFRKEEEGNYSEAAHITPLEEGGSNTTQNILILCPTCHKKLDLGCEEARKEVIENVKDNFPDKDYNFEEL